MYCRKCKYDLQGLDDRRCPECGTDFDRTDFRTFLRALPTPLSTAQKVTRLIVIGVAACFVAFLIQFVAAVNSSGH
jgi:hypothetical protein